MATRTQPKPKPSRNGPAASEVLTLAEAAAFLRVTEEAVRGELEAGQLGGRKLAGEWRVSKAAILRWLDSPTPRLPLTGAELVAHAQAVKAKYGFTETEEEVEAFLASIRANRQADD